MKKNSILNDEAYIYNHRDNENEGDKWKKMSRREKLTYFNDYYRNKIIVILIVVGLIVSFLYTIFSPRPDVVVSVAVVNDFWGEAKLTEMEEELTKYLELKDGEEEILVDDSYFLEESGMGNEVANTQRLVAKIAAGDVNVIIADKAKFDEFATSGSFAKVSEVIKDADLYKERISSDGYGISLKGSKLLESLGSAREEMVLGVLGNADNKDYEYISKLVNYILQKS